MTDEKTMDAAQAEETAAETEEPHGETAKAETDWKAEARKWEARAKENKAAADELEQLKQSQLTEQQKAEQRADRAEAELKQLRAEKQHAVDVREVAAETGAPQSLLECCESREAMEQLAEAFKTLEQKAEQTPTAPRARASRIVRDNSAAPETRDIFAQFVNENFRK